MSEFRSDFETFCRRPILEDYLHGRLSIAIDVSPWRDGDAVSDKPFDSSQAPNINASMFVLQLHAINSDDLKNWRQEFVFVVNVEVMKGAHVAVPSSVRFQVIHQESEDARGWIYFSSLSEGRFKVVPIVPEGHFVVPSECPRAKSLEDSAPSVIKSAPEIMNRITRHKGNIGANGPVAKDVIQILLPRLRVDLEAGWVSINRGAESLLNIRDVLLGPFDF
jgi:hypothetical protein